jgi:hypothetical protein
MQFLGDSTHYAGLFEAVLSKASTGSHRRKKDKIIELIMHCTRETVNAIDDEN